MLKLKCRFIYSPPCTNEAGTCKESTAASSSTIQKTLFLAILLYGEILGNKSAMCIRVALIDHIVISSFGYILYCVCFNKYCVCCNIFCYVWVCVCVRFVMCGCFGNMCTCIYCVFYCLYCVFCIVSFMFVCTNVRTTATV